MAENEASPVVRLYLASAAQKIAMQSRRGQLLRHLALRAEDAEDHNLPLMYWYAIEPLVPGDLARAMKLAKSTRIETLTRYVLRRAATDSEGLNSVISEFCTDANDKTRLYLECILQSFSGRANIQTPDAWGTAYDVLKTDRRTRVRELADQIAVILGDQRVYPRFRSTLTNRSATIEIRKEALEILVRGRDVGAATAYLAVLDEPMLRGLALRALSQLADPGTPAAIFKRLFGIDSVRKT